MKKLLRHRGFTLIELLVVIGIIGFLASIVIASLQSSREVAQAEKTTTDVAQIKLALTNYYQDYGGYPICKDTNGAFKQTCCIGGTTCSAGAITATGALSELTALLDTVHETQYAKNPTQLMASIYYRQKLANPVIYNCSAFDSSSGKSLCSGTVSVTYFTVRNAVVKVTTDTLSDPGASVGGVCADQNYEGFWSDPKSATCGRPVACIDPLSNQYKTGDTCSTYIACTDPSYVENWDGLGRACFTKVQCTDPAYYEYHTASACTNLIPTGGGGCTDPAYVEYGTSNPCTTPVSSGCTDPSYVEYGTSNSCATPIGCTDPAYVEYGTANACATPVSSGCTDPAYAEYGTSNPCTTPI